MDPVRVMQISASLVEPLGMTALGRIEHHSELLDTQGEWFIFQHGAACPESMSGISASQGRDGTAEKEADSYSTLHIHCLKTGSSAETLGWRNIIASMHSGTLLTPVLPVPEFGSLCLETVMPHGCRALYPRGIFILKTHSGQIVTDVVSLHGSWKAKAQVF